MKGYRKYIWLSFLVLGCVLASSMWQPLNLRSAPLSPQEQIEHAWQQALTQSGYHYACTVVQTTWPTLRLENAGLSSQQTRFYLEGAVSRPQEVLRLKLWRGAGRVGADDAAFEVKVERGRAYGRTSTGGAWHDLTAQGGDGFTDLFAPGSDPLAYLVAATDVRDMGAGELRIAQQTQAYRRFGFAVDGPSFATYMRDEVQARLEREGRWPAGVAMDVARQYVHMQGSGELWIGADGLPLRQVIHVRFPPQEGAREWVEAEITSDFAQWDADPMAGTMSWSKPFSSHPAQVSSLAPLIACLTLAYAFLCLTRQRRSPLAYAAVVVMTLFAMLVTPLVQSHKVYAFAEAQRAQVEEQTAAQSEQETAREAEAALQRPNFAPHVHPLAQAQARAAVAEDVLPAWGGLSSLPTWSGLSSLPTWSGLSSLPVTNAAFHLPAAVPENTAYNAPRTAPEAGLDASDTISDTDGDGLDDYTETAHLGTDPELADSDGDLLSDAQEVQGFQDASGQWWYTDPRSADTNRDGRSDGVECTAMLQDEAICDDTDGDGTPDIWDYDDDNDGVPDLRDTSPSVVMGGGRNADNSVAPLDEGELNFQLDQYEAGKRLIVDFQLRPHNPQHLWYTLNVLDWPAKDREGQIQRVFTSTFGASGKQANGDLKLIPMLEIEIPYEDSVYGGLPVKAGAPPQRPPLPALSGDETVDTRRLNAWLDGWLDRGELDLLNVSVRVKDTEGTLLAYVPLTLVQDQVGDSPVAFTGQMLYRPTVDDFGTAHKIRLAWALYMLYDVCNTDAMPETFPHPKNSDETVKKSDERAVDLWCHDKAHWIEAEGVVHTYYDDWYLTGMNVREDHGMTVGIVHEDPARYAAGSLSYEDNLWTLAKGLDASFLTGRVDEGRQRDLSVAEIKRRFDRDSNAGVSDVARWGIAREALAVHTYALASQLHIGAIPMTHTKEILSAFTVPVSTTVTLLFAREERYRALGLPRGVGGVLVGNDLKLALNPARVKEEVLATLNWAPYRYEDAGVWTPYAISEYWEEMDARFKQVFRADVALLRESDDQIAGRVLLAKQFYLSVYKGGVSLVERDGITLPAATFKSDAKIGDDYGAKPISGAVKDTLNAIVKHYQATQTALLANKAAPGFDSAANTLISSGGTLAATVLEQLGWINEDQAGAIRTGVGALKSISTFASLYNAGKTTGQFPLMAGTLVAVGATVLLTLLASNIVVKWILKVVNFATQIISVAKAIKDLADAIKLFGGTVDALNDAFASATSACAIIGLIFQIGTAVGLFLIQWGSGVLEWGMSLYEALGTMLAAVMVAVVMFALSLIVPIGTLISAIIGLIDLLVSIVCGYFPGIPDWICTGISSRITGFFQWLLLDTRQIVDLEAPGRLRFGGVRQGLAEPDKGFVVGNRLDLEMDVITGLYRSEECGTSGDCLYPQHYDDSVLNAATFAYYYTQDKEDKRRVSFFQMQDIWQPTGETGWLSERFTATQTVAGTALTFTHASLAFTGTFYLMESYAVPAQLCTLGGLTCRLTENVDVNPIDMGNMFVFDVFPATLDDFYSLTPLSPPASGGTEGGYAPASGGTEGGYAPTSGGTEGGYAPTSGGTEGGYAPTSGGTEGGYAPASGGTEGGYTLAWDPSFPTQCDADGDGLRSHACGGPDPADGTPDSDGDGLSDFWETQHASAGYDPLQADADGDGLTDYWEAFYETDPRQADSDYDGLADGDEVFHYENANALSARARLPLRMFHLGGIPTAPSPRARLPLRMFHLGGVGIPETWSGGWHYLYDFDEARNPLRTRVTSDPNDPDADGDGLQDGMEQAMGLNPHIASEAQPFTLQTRLLQAPVSGASLSDGVVQPGQHFSYQAILQNVVDRFGQGQFTLELPATVQAVSALPPQALELQPGQTLTLTTQARVDEEANTQVITFTSHAGAAIVDRRSAAGGRVLWLRMDGDALRDDSLDGNTVTCSDGNCPTIVNGGYEGQALPLQVDGPHLIVADREGLRTNTLSAGLWVSPSTGSLAGNWIHKAGAYNLYTDAEGFVHFQVGNGVTLHSSRPLLPGQWNHTFISYDKREARLYLDGELDASADYSGAAVSLQPVVIGQDCTGLIDEVELYPRALNAREVAAKFKTPLLALSFEDPPSAEHLSCGRTPCPARSDGGPQGQYPTFDNTNWYSLALQDSLNLNRRNGHFSYAAWVLPHASPPEPDGTWAALWGAQVPTGEGNFAFYPTLYQQDARLRVRFVTTNTLFDRPPLCDSGATGDILTLDTWQHVAVTFNGAQFTFYVNGQPAAQLAGTNCQFAKPAPLPATSSDFLLRALDLQLGIGRADAASYLYIPGMQVLEEDAEDYALYLSDHGDEPVWKYEGIRATDWLSTTPALHYFYGDGVEHWFDVQISASSEFKKEFLNYDFMPTVDIASLDELNLHYRTYNAWFNGELDEIQIYGYALDAADVNRLYLAQGRPLALAVDEPPGATRFANRGSAAALGVCVGTACPASGIPGRANQALKFDGTDDTLALGTAEQLQLNAHSFTAAAWVKAEALDGERAVFGTANGDFFLGVHDGKPVLRFSASNALTSTITLETGQWYHLAWRYDKAAQQAMLFVNGTADADASGHAALTLTGDVALGGTSGKYFSGLLDEISIHERALSPDDLIILIDQVPAISLHLDETEGDTFADSGYDHPATCADATTCPFLGAKGKVYAAPLFDGIDDALHQDMGSDVFLEHSFTIAAWVRGRDFSGERGIFAAQGTGAGDRLALSMVNGYPRLELGVAPVLTGTAVASPNIWTHVAARYDAERGEVTLFVNGLPNASAVIGDPGFNGARMLRWGQSLNPQSTLFGALDEVAVYVTVLPDADIRALYEYQLAWYDETFTQQVLVDADDPTAYVDAGSGYVRATDTVLAVIARDATSGIAAVEVRVDNGPWIPAVADEGAWLFTFNADHSLNPGLHTVFARATDQAGNVGIPIPRPVFIDGAAPTVALAPPGGTVLLPQRVYNVNFDDQRNRWLLGLHGEASDDRGLAHLWVSLRDLDGLTVGQAQFVKLDGEYAPWDVTYPLPYAPRGMYTLEIIASDLAGNTHTYTQTATLRADATAPWAEITQVNSPTQADWDSPHHLIGPSATITGVVVDVPYPAGALLTLRFEEQAAAGTHFYDSSHNRYTALCTAPACPTRSEGLYGQAASFDGSAVLHIDAAQGITRTFAGPRATLSALAWVKLDALDGVQTFVATDGLPGDGFSFGVRDGYLTFAAGSQVYSTTARLSAGSWQHVAAVLDTANGTALTLYVDGDAVAVFRDPPLLPANFQDGLHIGAGLQGALDDVFLHSRAMSAAQIQDIGWPAAKGVLQIEVGFLHAQHFDAPEPSTHIAWQLAWQAPLTQTTLPLFQSWTYTVPDRVLHTDGEAGYANGEPGVEWLEGPYQIYLRTTDAVGHQQVLPAVWSGEVDTAAPRITFQKYAEVENGASYLCDAQDYNLSDDGFVCAGNGPEAFNPGYVEDSWYTMWFSDTARLVRYSAPQGRRVSPPNDSATACDIYGQCSTVAPTDVTCAQITLEELGITSVDDGLFDTRAELYVKVAGEQVWEQEDVAAGATHDLAYTTRRCNADAQVTVYEKDTLGDDKLLSLQIPSSASGIRTESFNQSGIAGWLRWSAVQVTPTLGMRAPQQNAPGVLVLTPPPATTLTALTPLTLSGQVEAPEALSALSVTVNSNIIYTQTWSAPGVLSATWSTAWTPTVEGVYTVTAVVQDRAGQTAEASTAPVEPGFAPQPLIVYVDLSDPALAIASQRVSQANYDDGYARIQGWVTDTTAIAALAAQVNGGAWQSLAASALPLAPRAAPWQARVYLGANVRDNAPCTITVGARDVGAHIITATQSLWVDITPPAPVTLTLTYTNAQGVATKVQPRTTLRDVLSPTLHLAWTPSASSDVAGYTIEWLQKTAAGWHVQRTVEVTTSGPFRDSLTVGEAQQWRVRVSAHDTPGNRTEQTFGPLYIDHHLTPVYVEPFKSVARPELLYHDWIDDPCNILGIDARRARRAAVRDTLHTAQKFYAAWDTEGLRLAWRGANWDKDGDLFIYLDTHAGGSWQAMNPYPATITNTAVMLPLTWDRVVGHEFISYTFTADVALWVKNSHLAEVWAWDGEAWQPTDAAVDYAFDGNAQPPLTDLYIPFSALRLSEQAVGMVAFATEEQALRTWAAMPSLNPVNSSAVVGTRLTEGVEKLLLTKLYTWDAFDQGSCPNGVTGEPKVHYTGADVQVTVNAAPIGLSYSIYRDRLYSLVDELLDVGGLATWEAVDNGLCPYNPDDPECQRAAQSAAESDRDIIAQETLDKIMDTTMPPVGEGQWITYTLSFVNQGVGTAPGLEAYALTWGPVHLQGGELVTRVVHGEYWEWDRLVFPLGDLAPGQTLSHTFSGWIDTSFDPNNNEGFASIEIVAYDENGSEWDEIDWIYIDHPVDTGAPFAGIETGYPLLGPEHNQLQGYAYDDLSPVYTVTVETEPANGDPTRVCPMLNDYEWACDWDLGGAQEGQQASARARSHDAFGFMSDWTRWMTFTVDATVPALTLDAATRQALRDGLIGPSEMQFSGSLNDNRLVSGVEVCEGVNCVAADFTVDETTLPQSTFVYRDAPTTPMTITSNNCDQGEAHAIPFVVVEDFTIVDVDFGLNITHPYRDDIKAYLYSPAGTRALLLWWSNDANNYDVLLDDEATRGNYGDHQDHDPEAPYFENVRWPSGFLGSFDGEQSKGTWWLTLCDYYPDNDTGTYNRSRLILHAATLPQNTRAVWRYNLPEPDAPTDTQQQTLSFTGLDSVGNHSAVTVATFTLDTVLPSITVTTFSNVALRSADLQLAGLASDRHGIRALRLNALDMAGTFSSAAITMTGTSWRYSDPDLFKAPGEYKLWVEAEDNAGNRRLVGPLALTVGPTEEPGAHTVYLPLLLRE